MPDNRARYIATALQAIVLGVVTYYGVKWLVDALDPTKKSRLAAQKQVRLEACCYHRKKYEDSKLVQHWQLSENNIPTMRNHW